MPDDSELLMLCDRIPKVKHLIEICHKPDDPYGAVSPLMMLVAHLQTIAAVPALTIRGLAAKARLVGLGCSEMSEAIARDILDMESRL